MRSIGLRERKFEVEERFIPTDYIKMGGPVGTIRGLVFEFASLFANQCTTNGMGVTIRRFDIDELQKFVLHPLPLRGSIPSHHTVLTSL